MIARLSESTIRTREAQVKHFLAYLAPLDELATPGKAQKYLDFLAESGHARSTIATRAATLRAYFRDRGLDVHLEAPKIGMSTPKYLELGVVLRLIDACSTARDRALVTVLFDGALRISELLSAKVEDIDWNSGFLHIVGKGNFPADVPLSQKAVQALREWLSERQSDDTSIFIGLTYYNAWRALKKMAKRAGIGKFNPHMLRHSMIIHMLDCGLDMYQVQQFARHRSIETTANVYGRFRPGKQKEWREKAKW